MIESAFRHTIQLLKIQRLYLFVLPGILVTIAYWSIRYSLGWTTEEIIPEDAGWLQRFLGWLSETGKWVLMLTYQFFMITVLSPVMGILAEQAETELTGKTTEGGLQRLLANLLRTIGIGLSAFVASISIFLVWGLIAWIGGLSHLTPYLLFFVNSFFIGFAYLDYALERESYSIVKSWRFAISHSWKLVGAGMLFYGIFYLPIVGPVLAPFLITLISTAWWVQFQNNLNK
jgi:uncharacterized protein involved in cysteine biosynthesis